MQNREPPDHHNHASDTGAKLADRRRQRGAGHIHFAYQNQENIQRNIDRGRHDQEKNRRPAVPQGAENAAGHVVQDAAGNCHKDDPDIAGRSVQNHFRRVHQAEQRFAQRRCGRCKDHAHRGAQYDRVPYVFPQFLFILRAEGLGNRNGKPGAEPQAQPDHQEIDAPGGSDRGQLRRAEIPADDGGIHKAVKLLEKNPEQQGKSKGNHQLHGVPFG